MHPLVVHEYFRVTPPPVDMPPSTRQVPAPARPFHRAACGQDAPALPAHSGGGSLGCGGRERERSGGSRKPAVGFRRCTPQPSPSARSRPTPASSLRHGQRPSISVSSEKLKKVRMATMAARRPTLSKVSGEVLQPRMRVRPGAGTARGIGAAVGDRHEAELRLGDGSGRQLLLAATGHVSSVLQTERQEEPSQAWRVLPRASAALSDWLAMLRFLTRGADPDPGRGERWHGT